MNVSLTAEIEQFIKTQVEIGRYNSTEEVIVAGIRLLKEREQIYKGRFEELQKEIMIGLAVSERGEVLDESTVFSQLRHKLEERRQQAGE